MTVEVGELSATHICLPLLLLLLEALQSPFLLSVRIFLFFFYTLVQMRICVEIQNLQKRNACLECKPMGMKMISQSAIKRSTLDLGCFPAQHIQDGSGKPRVPAASTLWFREESDGEYFCQRHWLSAQPQYFIKSSLRQIFSFGSICCAIILISSL